jgi:uncharacterized protein (TIGR01244 family)
MPGLVSAGQPEPRHWRPLAAAGLRSVIDLRPASEQPQRDEAAEVAAAGMRYLKLPIADAQALGRDTVVQFDRALGLLPAPVLVHCASGNRVGALIALRAAWLQALPATMAIDLGRVAGLTGLEPRVRQLLSAPA